MDNVIALFDGNTAYAFAWTMLHSLWQCTLIAAALAISLRMSRRHSANARYLQGIFALIICVVVSATTFARHYDSIANVSQTMQAFGAGLDVRYAGGIWEQLYTTLNDSIEYILLLWLLGFVIQCYRYMHDFVQALMLKHSGCESVDDKWKARFDALAQRVGLTKTFSVRNSCRITSTCIIGHFKPVVLLPAGMLMSMPMDQVEAIVLHELAHIKRNDYLVNTIQCMVRALYFFNPAVLWITSRIDLERENACDDIAVKYCGSRRLYADSLTNISELELKLTTVMAAKKNRHQMLLRVKRLFSNASGLSKNMEQLVSVLCVSLVIVAMNVSAEEYDFLNIKNVDSMPVESNIVAAATTTVREVEPAVPETQEIPVAKEPVVTALKADPEVDYAVKHIAMNESDMNTVSRTPLPARSLQLADASSEMDMPAAHQPKASSSALEPMETRDFSEFYVASSFKLPMSRKIYIADASVVFSDLWMQRFHGKTSSAYRESIEKDYGQALVGELKKALLASGWQVVNSPSADALRLNPKLIELYISEPESVGLKQTIVRSIGQAGVELVFQTPDARPFMKIVDYRNTQNNAGSPFVANKATNFYYFRLLMTDWSDRAVLYLDEVMALAHKQN